MPLNHYKSNNKNNVNVNVNKILIVVFWLWKEFRDDIVNHAYHNAKYAGWFARSKIGADSAVATKRSWTIVLILLIFVGSTWAEGRLISKYFFNVNYKCLEYIW